MFQLKNDIANMFILSIHYVQDGIEKNTPDSGPYNKERMAIHYGWASVRLSIELICISQVL
jgi:hypothetical protein